MKKSKNLIKFIAAILGLIIIPLMPLSISKIQDNKLINHLQVEQIKNEKKEIQTSKLKVAQKLELISNYNKKEKNIITTTQLQDMSEDNINKIRTIINEQLAIIKKFNILNDVIFDQEYICYNYTLRRYSDIMDTNKTVSIYQVDFTNDKGAFGVTIDVDSHLIYQFNYYNKNYITRNNEVMDVFGVNYLGLSEEETKKYLYSITDKHGSINVSSYNYY